DRRGVEERDLAALAEAGGRRLTAEPAAEAPGVARQPPAAVDAERLLHAQAEPPVAVRPVGEPREGGAEPPEQLGVAEEAVAAPAAGADVVDPLRLGGQGRRSGSLRRPRARRHAHALTGPGSGDPW